MEDLPTKRMATWARRCRSLALRAAGLGFVTFVAVSAPVDETGRSAVGDFPAPAIPSETLGLTVLPDGWPAPAPAPAPIPAPVPTPHLTNAHEADIWKLVWNACERYDCTGDAPLIYDVLWEESRLHPEVKSPCGRYLGMAQFKPSTFDASVKRMQQLGLLPRNIDFSPYQPEHAIEVMAWMWSQGYENHWGPYRRVARRFGRTVLAENRPN